MPRKLRGSSSTPYNPPGGGAVAQSTPKGPGGAGFLINPHAFSDVRMPHPGKSASRTPRIK